MIRRLFYSLSLSAMLLSGYQAQADGMDLVPVSMEQRIQNSLLIAEGTVLSQYSFWDQPHARIYTSNLVRIHRVLKGGASVQEIEIITEGGTVDLTKHVLSATLTLSQGQTGIFFCHAHNIEGSPRKAAASYMVYASMQGFLEYDRVARTVRAPFEQYPQVGDAIDEIKAKTGVDIQLSVNPALAPRPAQKTTATPTISSFSPTAVTAGTGTTLTINGSNFGSVQGTGYVEFKNANNGGSGWIQPLATDYVSWSDNQIIVKVPSSSIGQAGPAGTGQVRVTNSDPSSATSAGTLTVNYSITNVEYSGASYIPYHRQENGAGGMTFVMYSGFASSSGAAPFIRALNTWTCASGMNWIIGANTATNVAGNDGENIVRFDVGNEVPAGVLGRATTYYTGYLCNSVPTWFAGEVDVVFDDIAAGNIWEFGPANAAFNEYDFETIAVHELGHAHQLGHIIAFGNVMHYGAANGQTTRTLNSASDIPGAQYMMTRSTGANGCGMTPTSPLSCPYHFRSAATGNWNNTATWQTSNDNSYWINAAVTPAGDDALSITVQNGHTVTVTSDVNVDELTVNSGGVLNVDPAVALTVNDGTGTDVTVASGGSMVLRSTAAGDARIPQTSGSFSGSVTVERYIPASGNRAWRLLGMPVSSTGAPTIYNSWQEGGANPSGYGTHITQAGGAGVAGSWDAGISTSSSIRQYNSATNTLSTPSGTNISVASQPAWYLFIRGDRNVNINSLTANSNTTLRTTGALKTGDQDFTVPATNWALIGNPYASPIDFALARANSSTTNTLDRFWVWDPKLNNVGGYVLFDGSLGFTPSVTGGSYTGATSVIQSGQAFFVKSNGTAGNFRIQEDDKASGYLNVFKTTNGTDPMLRVKLNMTDPVTSAFIPADGVIAAFNNSYAAAIDHEDGSKMTHFGSNLALVRNGQQLTIEKRPDAAAGDTLYLNLVNATAGSYQLEVEGMNFTNANIGAFLADAFQNTLTPLSLTSPNTISFTTTSNALSAGNRFSIVFQNIIPLADHSISIQAEREADDVRVSWSSRQEAQIRTYELEGSQDARSFHPLTAVPASGKTSYAWLDQTATEGNNYYRIKAIDNSHKTSYSAVACVKGRDSEGSIAVTPNPVTGGAIALQLYGLEAGAYQAELYDISGQLVYNTELVHGGGSSVKLLHAGDNLAKGAYTLRLSKGRQVFTQKLVNQ